MRAAAFGLVLAVSLVGCADTKVTTATNVVLPPPLAKANDPTPSPSAAAATPAPPKGEGPLWLLRDTGKRCFAAPCPSWAAIDVKTREEREVTGVDVSAMSLDASAAEAARARILAGQVWVRGEIKKVPKQGPAGDGTVLYVNALVEAHEAAP